MHYGVDLLTRKDYEDWLKEIPEGVCPLCQWRMYQYLLYQGRENKHVKTGPFPYAFHP